MVKTCPPWKNCMLACSVYNKALGADSFYRGFDGSWVGRMPNLESVRCKHVLYSLCLTAS